MDQVNMKKEIIYCQSPVGPLEVEIVGGKLCALRFAGKHRTVGVQSPQAKPCLRQLAEYFTGRRCAFDLPLHLEGTSFQKKVWRQLMRIPHGQTASYADIARAIGHPKAVRAVGNANGKNPLPILIPCHRVIASDGTLGGYSSGLQRKRWLLRHEQLSPSRA
jgi:O-6-methylguanine DNA methyltransferase